MLCYVLLMWVAIRLSAPSWFFTVLWVAITLKLIELIGNVYKAGKNAK